MKHAALTISSTLLVAAAPSPVTADPPVFTFSMGIRGAQNFACVLCPDGSWQCPRPAPWMRVDANSTGTVNKQGNVPFDIVVKFEPNLVSWELLTPVHDIATGVGCTDGCCGEGDLHWITPLPSVSCGTPIYPTFYPESNSGCRPDQWSGSPVMSVIADGLPNPNECGVSPETLLNGCQSGTVRYTFCREDFDASGSIDGGDLGNLLACWGAGQGTYPPIWMCERVDLDGDGAITGADLGILLAKWGECAVPNG